MQAVAHWRVIHSPLQWAFAFFLAYAVVSFAWTPVFEPWALLQLTIIGIGFFIGTQGNTDCWYFLLAWLTFIFTIVANYQTMFVFNPMVIGQVAVLLIIALACERLWLYIPLLFPAVALSHSRGAWLGLALGIAALKLRKPIYFIIAILAVALFLTWDLHPNDQIRLRIWSAALSHLSPFGNGAGSFLSLWLSSPAGAIHPEFVHNDFLQLLFEFGPGALPLFVVLAYALYSTQASQWPLVVTFGFFALFSFPLQTPATALIGAICLGHIIHKGDYNGSLETA